MTHTSNKESGLVSKENELVLENTEINKNTATKRRGRPARTTTRKTEVKTPVKKDTATISKVKVEPVKTEIAQTPKKVDAEPVKTETTTTPKVEAESVKTEIAQTPKKVEVKAVETETVTTQKAETKPAETNKTTATPKVATKTTKAKAVKKTTPKKEEVAVKEAKEIIKKVTKDETMAEEVKNENDVVEEKKEALKEAKAKFKEAVTLSLDEELAKVENVEVISSQFNKSSDFVENMLTKLMQHLEMSEIQGRKRVEDAVDGLLGDNIVNDIVTTTLGYVGGKAAKGYTMGTAPAVAVSGAVKGAYKKIVD